MTVLTMARHQTERTEEDVSACPDNEIDRLAESAAEV